MSGPTRREFLWASAAVAAAGALGGPPAVAQPGSVRARRSVFSPLAPIDDYRTGVREMKTRPATDPTSWRYQANMHGTTAKPPQGALWSQCQHGSFFFLSWHRMYVYWFERIVRKASGNDDFALPYWNYTSTAASDRQIPLAFRQAQFMGQTNALFHARAPGLNNISNPSRLPYSATLYATAFAYTNFSSPSGSGASFGGQVRSNPAHQASPHGQLEAQPHDVIHSLIGGPTGADMGSPNRAARDPIFWLHHANTDRLWKRWLQQGGGRADPTGNAAWMKTVFRFFDENGKEVKMTGADILNTITQLQYRYDDDPVVLAPAAAVAAAAAPKVKELKAMQTVATAEKTGVGLGDRPVPVTIALKERAKAAIKRLAGADAADAPAHAVILRLEDVTFDKQPGTYYEVYLNLPAKEDPDFQNGRYVGNLGLFAKPHAGGKDDHKMADVARISADFDISGVVRELAQQKKWDADQLTVTFVPRGLEGAKGRLQKVKTEAKIKVGKITLNSPKE